jgi:PAS domain S-box-containing protein
MKTLIVEDDMMSQCLLAKVLAERGHDVVSFENAEQAVLAYQKEFYPLLFVDVGLPGMDGLQFCKWVRAQPNGDKVFIMVAVSAGQPNDLGEVLAVGAQDFLPKPYDVGALNVRLTIAETQMKEFFDRKELEGTLRASQEAFARVVKAASEGAWLLDARFRTEYANPQMAAMLGYPLEELANRPVMDFLAETARRDAEQLFAQQKEGWEIKQELVFRRKDGSACVTSLSAAPVCAAGGDFKGSLWMVTDLSGRMRLEAELTETRTKFEAYIRDLNGDLNKTTQSLETESRAREKAEQTLQQARAEFEAQSREQAAARAAIAEELKAEQASKRQAEEAREKAQLDSQTAATRHAEELARADRALQAEVAERKHLGGELLQAREETARRVKEHIAEMVQAGHQLNGALAERKKIEEELNNEAAARKRAESRSVALLRLCAELSAARSPNDAARVLSRVAQELLGWDACNFDLYSAEENKISPLLNLDMVNGRPAEVPPTYAGPEPSPVMKLALRDGAQLIVRSGSSDSHTDYILFGDRAKLSESLMCVAVRAGNKVLGFFSVHSYRTAAYDQEGLEMLQACADHCGGVLERVRTVEAQRRSEERFQLINRVTNDAVWEWDLKNDRDWWNESLETLFGRLSGETETGSGSWSGRIHPQDKDRVLNSIQSALQGGGHSWSDEYRFCRGDGSYAHVLDRAYVVRGEGTRPTRMIGAMADISQRKLADTAHSDGLSRYGAIVDSTLDALVAIDPEGMVLEWNLAAEKMFGFARADVLGKELAQLIIPPASRERHRAGLRLALNSVEGRSTMLGKRIELKAVRADGTEFPIEMSVTRIASDGPPTFTGFIRDITERAGLEAQLRHNEKMESISHVAAGVAHDFNNLLGVIQGYSTLLMEETDLKPEMAESVKQIALATERATHLTRQLQTFGRKHVVHDGVIDLNELINNVGKLLRRAIGENVALQFNYSANLPAVEADAAQLEQVLMNLATNARDAMSEGGQLTIATKLIVLDETRAQRRSEARPGRFVCLTVSDAGRGMDEVTLGRIFEPFFTTKAAGQGTGLGLATVYGIIKQHRGWIEVQSQVGRGTTFDIYLPASAKTVAVPASNGSRVGVRGGTETILLVEDEPAVLTMAKSILQRLGYQVLAARCGDEAVPIWQQNASKISLLLTDMVMPGSLNGRDLAEKLLQEGTGLKVVYTSGYSIDLVGPGLATSKNFVFLQKPYHPEMLAQTVRDCLDGKSA